MNQQNIQMEDVNFTQLLSILWRGKGIILLAMSAALLLGILYLHLTTYQYTATITLTAAQSSSGDGNVGLGALGGLASVAGISVGSSQTMTPFQLYAESATSHQVAEVLAQDSRVMHTLFFAEWDEATTNWQEPDSALRKIINIVKVVIGVPVAPWKAPETTRLQSYLDNQINVEQDSKKPLVTLTYSHKDPEFALYLIQAINKTTDDLLRQQTLSRTSEYIKFLTEKLQTTSVAEHRDDIAQALSDQEKLAIFAQSNSAFAAQPIDTATVSARPTSPKPLAVLVASLFLGCLLGSLVVLVRSVARPRISAR